MHEIHSVYLSFVALLLIGVQLSRCDPTFCARSFHSAVVGNDTLWMDGGEIRFIADDGSNKVLPYVVNATQSIDLSKRWSNTDSNLITYYNKPVSSDPANTPPKLNDQTLWFDGTGLIQFGGALSLTPSALKNPPPQGTWRYDIAKHSWSKQGFGGSTVQRTFEGGSAQSTDGRGFALGGSVSPLTDPQFHTEGNVYQYLVEGLITLDEKSRTFTNSSTKGMNSGNTIASGYMNIIENVGAKGILVAFGGTVETAGKSLGTAGLLAEDPAQQNKMDTISIYNIATNTWFQQKATGDIPKWRHFGSSLVVSAQDSSSHSIYMFGGWGDYVSQSDGSVYVLSIPSFRWIRLNQDKTPRVKNKCLLMGQRTMLVVGGTQPTDISQFQPAAAQCDGTSSRFAQGLGIFSLQNHTWMSSYDPADDGPYELHKQITDVIGGNAKGGATHTTPEGGFNNNALKKLFQSSTSTTSSKPSMSSETSSASTTAVPPKKLSGGAIAGIVIGVIVGVALVAGIVALLIIRSRRRRTTTTNPRELEPEASPLPKKQFVEQHPIVEADNGKQPGELGGEHYQSMAELPVDR
ncbi:MAG: hypothetical protein M4579_006051 [Chaenotheca gracillima]|nr:MAG: hypothetical protein M4579_006051 [Chaenotheca gracillima]